jgi:hypothetical protein
MYDMVMRHPCLLPCHASTIYAGAFAVSMAITSIGAAFTTSIHVHDHDVRECQLCASV